ncbi:MAG: hypothetical protein GOMPHAMPRED_000605 [Gomphillus americanus]|uniref:LicD/FKTN/FKRP nucleotidyltransferase domain-containing protein n=1 Tax=Gomphillus americanus TaxID=1940652 RepID=A0A8H3EBB2_9LECA|nr:MAG: hypothetical protein GOMPHAMPRED_000605 [Gomphillus americanus]
MAVDLGDFSGKGGDPKQKFFPDESVFHPHYDGRFTDKVLKEEDRRPHLVAMIQAYLSTMNDLGAESWLMHGSLMGWWWNRKILPWDSDIDTQMTLDTMSFLFNYYQLYTFHYDFPEYENGKNYMLEINPDFSLSNKWDYLNGIDARWIDMSTGIFIDITVVRPNKSSTDPGLLTCKDQHKYNETDLFPLRDSWFEGIPCKVPYNYAWVLEEEYSRDSLSRTEWEGHRFNETTNEWERVKAPTLFKSGTRASSGRGKPRWKKLTEAQKSQAEAWIG